MEIYLYGVPWGLNSIWHGDVSLYCVWLFRSLPWPSTSVKKEVRGIALGHANLNCLLSSLPCSSCSQA